MPGAPRNAIADLGLATVVDLVNDAQARRSALSNDGKGCWLFTGSANNDGYGQIQARATRTDGNIHNYSLHRLAAVARTGVDIPAGFTASHLCDVRRCFRPTHIEVESSTTNNNRKGCIGSIVCAEHNHVLWACSHGPPCIRVPAVVQTCCLKVEQARQAANTTDAGQQMSQPLVDDYTAASLAANQPDVNAAVRTYAEVVRSRSVSRQSSVQPATQSTQAGPSRGRIPSSSTLTAAQQEAHRHTGFDPDAW